MSYPVVTDIQLPTLKLFKKGKVRSVYEFGDHLLMVSSDRISAFDYILNQGVPNKGAVLTQLSVFWFERFKDLMKSHFVSVNIEDFPKETHQYADILSGRSMWVKKTELIEIECVVRGYLVGSGWKEYQQTGTVCGISLPKGLKQASKLPQPIFTPAIKASSGHDENIPVAKMRDILGNDLTQILENKSMALYQAAYEYALQKGIMIADTKFEFGLLGDDVILIDEIFTPDSSRFWPKEGYQEGMSPPSFDKQIVRDYLEGSGWDKNPPIPDLPNPIIEKTSQSYQQIYKILVGHDLK